MQQLTAEYQVDFANIQLTPVPTWEDFTAIAQTLAAQFGFIVRRVEQGADRSQLVIDWQTNSYVLICEHLCHSMWIEGEREQQSLQALATHMDAC